MYRPIPLLVQVGSTLRERVRKNSWLRFAEPAWRRCSGRCITILSAKLMRAPALPSSQARIFRLKGTLSLDGDHTAKEVDLTTIHERVAHDAVQWHRLTDEYAAALVSLQRGDSDARARVSAAYKELCDHTTPPEEPPNG